MKTTRVAASVALATAMLACSGSSEAPGARGSAGSSGASNAASSGMGGARAGAGGTLSSAGSASGGASGAAERGGSTSAGAEGAIAGSAGLGGATSSNGGASSGFGGAGRGSGGSAAGGSGGKGATWTATDYVSRKWARWPIPNPPSMNLPRPMSYLTEGQTVVDRVTGLVWQKSTNATTTDWASALAYCMSLGDGWSLPTRIELTSIVDNARSGAKVDPAFVFGTRAGWTWASTPWVVNQRRNLTGAAALSWFINFAVGDSNNSLSQTATSAYARCVRVPATQTLAAEHYTIRGGEVVDNYTGLVWQQGHASAEPTLSFQEADAYCKALMLNGEVWRLPSLNELASLVDDVPSGDVSPAIDKTAFPGTAPDLQYWSASPYGASVAERWTLNFEDGFTAHRPTATLGSARCVR